MSTPTRETAIDDLRRAEAQQLLSRLATALKWGEAITQRISSGGGGRSSGPSDPVGGDAASDTLAYVRRLDRRAREETTKGVALIQRALDRYGAIEAAMGELQRDVSEEMSTAELERSGYRVRTTELRQAHRAQARRHERGEGWGTA